MKKLSAVEIVKRAAQKHDGYVLVLCDESYADEFNTFGVSYETIQQLAVSICEAAIHFDIAKKPAEVYFGTNEFHRFKNVGEFVFGLQIYEPTGAYVDELHAMLNIFKGGKGTVYYADREWEDVYDLYDKETGVNGVFSKEQIEAYNQWCLAKGAPIFLAFVRKHLNNQIEYCVKRIKHEQENPSKWSESTIKSLENYIKTYKQGLVESGAE
jgi:hypothetical protein